MNGVAILGCGLIAAKRVAAIRAPLAVHSVFDVDESRAIALARSVSPEVRVASSPDDALSGDITLAIVATYHRDLVPLASMAVNAGCHVLVEKPAGRNASEARALRASAQSCERTVRVGFNHRFHPAIIRARELIASGQYGELISVRSRYGHGGRPGYENEWRTDRELAGGGELLDQGVHLLDLVRHLTGEVGLAFAELRTDFWNCEVEDNAYLGLRPANGGFAWLHVSWTEWKNLFSFEIALERAKIEITGLGGSYGAERLTLYEMLPEMGPPQTTSWEWPFPDRSWEREMEDVLLGLAGGPIAGATIDDAIAVLEIVDAAYALSAKTSPSSLNYRTRP